MPRRTARDVLDELLQLKKASDEAFKNYVEFQARLGELQVKLEAMPDGLMRVKDIGSDAP